MAYDLIVEGVRDFARLDRVLAQRKIARDPLSGVVDGSNKVFYTNYSPILTSGSLIVYSSGSQVGGMADFDTGEVTLTVVPATQPLATYTFIPHTLSQQVSFLIAGFYLMEGRWARGWKLVDVAGVAADENSANVYVDDGGGGDPLSGVSAQIGAFMACCRYSYIMLNLTGAAVTDFNWRETVRGMSVDKSRRPQNLAEALKLAEAEMLAALETAQNLYYAGEQFGAYVGNPMTLEYVEQLEWQEGAKTDDNRAMRGNRQFLPLTV